MRFLVGVFACVILLSGCTTLDHNYQGVQNPEKGVGDQLVFASFEGSLANEFENSIAPKVFEERGIELVSDISVADFHIRFDIDTEHFEGGIVTYFLTFISVGLIPHTEEKISNSIKMTVYDDDANTIWEGSRFVETESVYWILGNILFPYSLYTLTKLDEYQESYNDLLDEAIRHQVFMKSGGRS